MSYNVAVYITGHGLGHLSQTVEVLIALYKQNTKIQFHIITSIPKHIVIARVDGNIPALHINHIYDKTSVDMGVPMIDAMQVDREKTINAYKKIHSHWTQHLEFEQQRLMKLQAHLVLSNVGYIPLQAATNIGVASVALSSLDWASTWEVYGSNDEVGKKILNEIVGSYQSATIFLQMTPHLPMSFLNNAVSVPFVVRRGKSMRKTINQRFSQCADAKIILISMGGMDVEINFDQWPKFDDVIYLVTGKKQLPSGFLNANEIDIDFSDLMASVDMVLTKTGYGIVVESVVNQTPLFYVPRLDWPENDVMYHWACENTQVIEINRLEFEHGLTRDKIEELLSQPSRNKTFEVTGGAEKCASYAQSILMEF